MIPGRAQWPDTGWKWSVPDTLRTVNQQQGTLTGCNGAGYLSWKSTCPEYQSG